MSTTTKESQTSPSSNSSSNTTVPEPPNSPKSIFDVKGLVLNVFRDLLDGMYSVIEEYEDDPEWNNKLEEEDSNDCEIILEEEDENDNDVSDKTVSSTSSNDNLMTCSTCGKKKAIDCFGYKSKDVPYKSCSECRNKKKRRYEEVKKVIIEEEGKRRKINSSAGGVVEPINRSINSNAGVATLDLSKTPTCVIN